MLPSTVVQGDKKAVTEDRRPLDKGVGRLVKVVEIFNPSNGMAFVARTDAILDMLVARGWNIRIITPSGSNPMKGNNAGPVGLRTYETWREELGSPLAVIFAPASIVAYVRAFRRFQADVVLVASISPFLTCEALLAAKLLQIPIAFDVRDSWIILERVHPGRVRNLIRKKLEGFALRHANLVVGVTRRQVELMRRTYRISDSRSIPVYLGCSGRIATDPPGNATLDLIHAGPPRAYYNSTTLLDGLARLATSHDGLSAAFLGVTPRESEKLRSELIRRNLAKRIAVLPPVPRDQVFDVLRTARIGVVALSDDPVYTAAISTKSMDYIAAGLPILYLGPADSEQADFIRKYSVGHVVETAVEFAEVADRLLRSPAALAELSARALLVAREMRSSVLLEPLHERLMRLRSSAADSDWTEEPTP